MKKFLLFVILILPFAMLAACERTESDNTKEETSETRYSERNNETENSGEDYDLAKIGVEINGELFTIEMEDNSSADALAEKLVEADLNLKLSEYGGFEKVGDLPWTLERNDENITTSPGDVILYQGNKITIYYAENTWDFTKLGKIVGADEDRFKQLMTLDEIEVRFFIDDK